MPAPAILPPSTRADDSDAPSISLVARGLGGGLEAEGGEGGARILR